MAQVTVTVNNKSYTLACDDGEEKHLTELAAEVDKRVRDLAASGAQPNEARLLLMAGLTLADDLALANERIAEAEEELAGLKDESVAGGSRKKTDTAAFDENEFAGLLESAARRMEDIAERLR
jgi:cell division protein ZapA